ncbi:MAG: hypothetical protein IT432_15605 [Phycisphaerales bacterium]|nr:hypothetical protein [Phycisphaerales bacterium]
MEATPADFISMIARPTGARLAAMVAAAVVMCAGSSTALAQYYRGGPANSGGNLLSRNLQRSGSGGGQTRDEVGRSMLNFRNSVIYGNAGGGLAFQGSIPYTAPSEFRGKLQSDALYAFRRDSFYSSVANSGVRSGDALAYRRSLTIGGQRPQGVEGSLSVPRGGTPRAFNPTSIANPTQGSLGRATPNYQMPSLGGLGGARRRAGAGSGASMTSQGTLNQLKSSALQNATGVSTRSGMYSQDDYNLTGDNLRSRVNSYSPQSGTLDDMSGQRSLDTLRPQTERMGGAAGKNQGPNQAGPQSAGPGRASGTPLTSIQSKPADQTNTTYDELRERIRKLLPSQPGETRPGASPDTTPSLIPQPAGPSTAMREFQKQIGDLSNDLRTDAARVGLTATARSRLGIGLSQGSGSPNDTGKPSDTTTRPFERTEVGPDGKPLPPDQRLGPTIDPKTLQIIRDAGARVDTFIPGGAARRDIYGESMAAGQQALSEARYFDAEERFARANSMRRGDTTSGVGMLHAQIGAGMALSAGRSLRGMLTEHPEMTAMRYADNLRPSAARTTELIERFRENVAAKGRLRRDSALLLAYLGYQSGDKPLVAEGLDALALADADDLAVDAASPTDARLIALLRGVWLAEDAHPDNPGAQPDAKPDPGAK